MTASSASSSLPSRQPFKASARCTSALCMASASARMDWSHRPTRRSRSALDQGQRPEVLAVQVQEIEAKDRELVLPPTDRGLQSVEVGRAIGAEEAELGVQDYRVRRNCGQRLRHPKPAEDPSPIRAAANCACRWRAHPRASPRAANCRRQARSWPSQGSRAGQSGGRNLIDTPHPACHGQWSVDCRLHGGREQRTPAVQSIPGYAPIGTVRRHAMNGTPETRYAKSGDTYIAYQVMGDGPFDLVLVPGFITHLDMQLEQPLYVNFVARLASFCRLIRFDKRGTGLSDRLKAIPTLEERMDDVRAVMDAAGSTRAALLGFSEGGPMSIVFAATYPQRTSALILYGSFARSAWAPDNPWGMTDEQLAVALKMRE